jgi:ABC-type lipoprotein export system ATPase subunit
MMADEPTGALDSATGAQIMDILSELNKCGSTVILITHDMAISGGPNDHTAQRRRNRQR